MKRSLASIFAIAVTITILTMGQPLYAQRVRTQPTQIPRTLPTPTPPATPLAPCCTVTAINTSTGAVTAKENATGRIITFQIAHFQPVDGAKLSQAFTVGGKVDFQPVDGAALTSGSNVRLTVQGFQPVDGIVASISTAAAPPAAPLAVGQIRNKLAPGIPCCNITAMDANTGVVTATESATGKIFQFKVTDSALRNSLKVGQGVYANFGASKVSVDGVTPCCGIVSAAAAPATGSVAVGAIQNKVAPGTPCCAITAMDTNTGVVTVKANATGRIFQFKVNDSALLKSLTVSQGVYANFAAKQVSINGSTPAGNIIIGETAYTGFDPTKQGFNFTNFFTGQILIDIPLFGTRDLGPTSYGLCGGMSYAALDNFISGGTLPNNPNDKTPPVSGTPLRSYLYARQHDTFVDDNAWMIRQFIEWVAYPDTTALGVTGLDVRSFKQFLDNIQPQLAAGHPVPLGLVKANISVGSVNSTDDNVLVKNHQVLAIGYKLDKDPVNGTHWDIQIYDPNYPGSIQLMHTHSNVAGYQTYDGSQTQTESFRGFFATPYSPKQPYWVSVGQQGHGVAIANSVPPVGAAPQQVSPPSVITKPSSPAAGVSHAVQDSALKLVGLPSVTAGTPQLVQRGGPQMAPIGPMGNRVNKDVVHLRGPDGIQQATNLPEGAKNLLLLHAYTLGPGEVDHYIVNTKLAADWIKAHPALAKVQPPSSHNSHAGCKVTITNPCLSEDAQHIADQTSQQINNLLDAGRQEWQHVTHELSHDLNMVEGCFADQTLHLNEVPIQIPDSIPQLTFHFNKKGGPDLKGNTSNQYGSASGDVTGVVTLGVPMEADFKAQVDMFWIECIPFFIRPKSIHADGSMSVGAKLGANLTANGKFTQLFTIPPTGGPVIPIEVIPIVIAGVPIAELDVSIYLDGTLGVDGAGKFDANLAFETRRTNNAFDFTCSGKSCELNSHALSSKPPATSESVKVNGRVYIKPAFYVALQLDFDVDALSVRAGPQPYLLGEVDGCYGASATQTLGGPSTAEQSYALTSDLDWGIELRAEALVGPKKQAERITPLWPRDHLAFWDLANSTALLPRVDGLTQASVGAPGVYTIKMPACYPYPDKVKYQLTWTGGATASNGASGATAATRSMVRPDALLKVSGIGTPLPSTGPAPPCNLQSGQGSCEFDPLKDLSLNLAWPTAGNYNLTVTAVGDTPHGRQYNSARPTTLNVTVGSSGSGTPTSASNGGVPSAPPSSSSTTTSAPNGATPSAPPSASGTTTSASNAGASPTPSPLVRPCCRITAVDPSSGVATAKVMSTGTIFQFNVTDSATLINLQLGQGVFANLPAKRVSLNGKGSCCDIVSVTPAQTSGTGVQTSSSKLVTGNPQTVVIHPDPNPNHLPDLVPDVSGAMGECLIPAGSSCQATCGSKKLPTNFGLHNLTQYPAISPIQLILKEIASGAVVQNLTVNGLGGNQWAYPGGFYTSWKCPTGTSFSSPQDNYTLEVQGPPQLTNNNKIQQFYIPPDAVLCPGSVDFSGCQQ